MSRTTRLALPLLMALLALPQLAQAQADELATVRMLLLTHHDAPSETALARAADDPVSALEALALEPGENLLVRRRAVQLLSRYTDARVEPLLVNMLAAPQGTLRRTAARGLSRRLGSAEPDRLVSILAPLLASSDPDDREAVVILLGETPSAAARHVLARHRIVERNRTVVAALRSVLTAPPARGQR